MVIFDLQQGFLLDDCNDAVVRCNLSRKHEAVRAVLRLSMCAAQDSEA